MSEGCCQTTYDLVFGNRTERQFQQQPKTILLGFAAFQRELSGELVKFRLIHLRPFRLRASFALIARAARRGFGP